MLALCTSELGDTYIYKFFLFAAKSLTVQVHLSIVPCCQRLYNQQPSIERSGLQCQDCAESLSQMRDLEA